MSEVLNDTTTPALITAIEANLVEMFSLNRYWAQAEVHDGKNLFWTITDVPFPLFNSILRAQLEPNDIDGSIKAAITRSKLRDVPILWWTGPATQPANLGEYLRNHNFCYKGNSSGMAVDLRSLEGNLQSLPEFSIEAIDNVETLRKWCHVLRTGFGMAEYVGNAFFDLFSSIGLGRHLPIRHYIGLLKGEPIAVSTLLLDAGVAGIYNVATVPNARRKGLGSAMIMKPLYEARAMGYRIGILQSSNMGAGVYRSLGFQEYCMLSHYVWSCDTEQSD
ncbi:MAG: GNAT family N-acetyltransferase [Desulfobacterales bacterium]|nr:GNAT family N-acetyltransferase [Desulfobacterales bacterium]